MKELVDIVQGLSSNEGALFFVGEQHNIGYFERDGKHLSIYQEVFGLLHAINPLLITVEMGSSLPEIENYFSDRSKIDRECMLSWQKQLVHGQDREGDDEQSAGVETCRPRLRNYGAIEAAMDYAYVNSVPLYFIDLQMTSPKNLKDMLQQQQTPLHVLEVAILKNWLEVLLEPYLDREAKKAIMKRANSIYHGRCESARAVGDNVSPSYEPGYIQAMMSSPIGMRLRNEYMAYFFNTVVGNLIQDASKEGAIIHFGGIGHHKDITHNGGAPLDFLVNRNHTTCVIDFSKEGMGSILRPVHWAYPKDINWENPSLYRVTEEKAPIRQAF